jgi:hypothetical protein
MVEGSVYFLTLMSLAKRILPIPYSDPQPDLGITYLIVNSSNINTHLLWVNQNSIFGKCSLIAHF